MAIKILLISDINQPIKLEKNGGGLEVVFLTNSLILSEIYDVSVFVSKDSDEILPGKTHYFNQNSRFNNSNKISHIKIFEDLLPLLKNDFDYIISHSTSDRFNELVSRLNFPFCVVSHTAPIYGMYSKMNLESHKKVIENGGVVCGVSEFVMNENNKVLENSTNYYMYHYISLGNFTYSSEKTVDIISAARFVNTKNHHIPIKFSDDISVEFYGEYKFNDKSMEYFQTEILPHINDTKRYCGSVPRDELLRRISSSKFVFVGGSVEALSNVAVEAFCSGVPIVKYGSRDGVEELINIFGEKFAIFPHFEKFEKTASRIKKLECLISEYVYPTESELEDLYNRANEYFSKTMFIHRFEKLLTEIDKNFHKKSKSPIDSGIF